MDNHVIPRDILESYDQITIEKQISNDIILFKLFDKDFLLICPDIEEPVSRASVYLYNDDGFDFPHIMLREEKITDSKFLAEGNYRWVCLYEQESVVHSIVPYEEKIIDTIDRLIELLSMTPIEREIEFQKEFMFYWNDASLGNSVQIYLTQEKEFSRMSVFCSKSEKRYIETGMTLSDLGDMDKKERKWLQHIEMDVFFIPIIDTRGILPPHKNHPWTITNVRDIVYGKQIDHINTDTFQKICREKVSTKDIVIVFGMQGVQSKVTFAAKLKCKNILGRTLFEKICEDALEIVPISTDRKDYAFLSYQIGNDIGLMKKKILLIGGGSLGSYVAHELVKNGVSSLKICDGDILADENIMRWAFGIASGLNKAKILSWQLEWLHPEIHIEAIEKNIDCDMLVEEVKNVDMVISTIGSSDTQLSFNKALKDNQCHIPVIYTWLEAGGKNSHILIVDYTKQGCYECLYTDEQGALVNNRANTYGDTDADRGIIRNGCGGTRAAYGTAVILRTTAALLDAIQKVLSGELTENTLIDITPESISYSSQAVPMEVCGCCGNRAE